MTQQFFTDSSTAGTTAPTPTAADSSGEPGTVDVAKEQAAAVGHGAAEAGQHVATVAKHQSQTVVAEAGNQAKDLIDQTRNELSQQASAQQQRLAHGLHALADELNSMTQHSAQPGVATDLARQGASRSHAVASWLETREPANLVAELKTFARRRPGVFLLTAAGVGLLAGRLSRGVKDAAADNDEPNQRSAEEPVASTKPTNEVAATLEAEPAYREVGAYPDGPAQPGFPLLGDAR
jgi:hypothetical protein